MTKPNFVEMSFQELRAYVLEHRDDDEAFYAFNDRMQLLPKTPIQSEEQLRQVI